jgi:murein DD-endopeptidase MepM/ murein hydrolase activator NlpD
VLADAGTTATVNSADGLNLRSGPGTGYDVVVTMPNGATATVTGAATADNWLPLSYGDKNGWADGAYLTLTQAATSSPTTSSPALSAAAATPAPAATAAAASGAAQTATVLPSDGLNERSNPDTSSSVVITLPGGATVTVTGSAVNGWVPVSYNGTSGWVDSTYLSMGGSAGSGATITANTGGSSAPAALGAVAGSGGSTGTSTNSAIDTSDMGKAGPPETGLPIGHPAASDLLKFIWPVDSRKISTRFSDWHQAIDIDEFPAGGNPVRAIADGIVIFASPGSRDGYGIYVIITHANGFSSLYAHFSALEVSQGQAVRQGQELGRSGCTGRCTGPHLHFAIFYHHNPLDPLSVLPDASKADFESGS